MVTVNENNPIILQTELLANQFVALFKERFVGEIIDASALKAFILQSIDTKKISPSTLETGLRILFQRFQVDIELDDAAFDTVITFTMPMQKTDVNGNVQAENAAIDDFIALMEDPTAYLAGSALERLKTKE